MEHIYLDFEEKQQGDVAILAPIGKMMGGPDTNEVHVRVKNFLNKGIKKIIIDLERVKWLNSSGIGTLVSCLHSAEAQGAKLCVVNLSGKSESVFFMTKLIDVFAHYPSVADAVKAYSA